MKIARVIGSVVSTIKYEVFQGAKLLLVQPRLADGRTPDGDPLLAVDGVGAGRGETVIITSDGRGARELLQTEVTPVRWTIIGIRDV